MSTSPRAGRGEDELLTIREVAALLKVSTISVHRWAKVGKLPGVQLGKVWRFRRRELEAWYESKR